MPSKTQLRTPVGRKFMSLTFEQVYRFAYVCYPEVFCQAGISLCHSFIHCESDIAIREMSGNSCAQLADVNCLGQIHLEQCALAECQGNDILGALFSFRRRPGKLGYGLACG